MGSGRILRCPCSISGTLTIGLYGMVVMSNSGVKQHYHFFSKIADMKSSGFLEWGVSLIYGKACY